MSQPENEHNDQFESAFEERFYNERLEKLEKIANLGAASGLSKLAAIYPNHFRFEPADITVPKIRSQFEHIHTAQLELDKPAFAIAGRIVAIRLQGKAGFATLLQNGERLQIYVRKDDVGEPTFDLYRLLDLGDHIGVRGTLMRTRTGELTLKAQTLTFLSKAMLPLPDKYSGLGDIELRYRRRYLDLFTDTGDTAEPEASSTPENSVILSEGPEQAQRVEGAQPKDPESASPTTTAGTISTSNATPPTELSSRPESQRSGDAAERPAGGTTTTRLPARTVFLKRAAILRALRKFFDDRHYLEVETPMLHTVVGGAAARPFNTHHNALDIGLNLRIAPELYLKRLVVGGFDRVYEINRNFRNEGVDTSHNPEFTMLEFYQAYANYHDLMDLTEELIQFVALEVNGTTITNFNGTDIDLSKWTKLSMREAIGHFWNPKDGEKPVFEVFESVTSFGAWVSQILPEPISEHNPPNGQLTFTFSSERLGKSRRFLIPAHAYLDFQMMRLQDNEPLGKVISELFEYVAEEHLIQPTIIYDFPLAVSPLSKVKPDEPDWVERFEFYIGGFEVGNAFSELNDPTDQRNRFLAQLEDKARGDDEAMEMDEDYVRALGYGLPPTAGEGIGIDRLTMLLTGSRSIRDVILFPLMRPHTKSPSSEDPTP